MELPLAYIDAGAGSLVVQALLGGVLASLVVIRSIRERAVSAFARLIGRGRGKEKNGRS